MKYFLDTEFHEHKKQPEFLGFSVGRPLDTIELISIGIVNEAGDRFYYICSEFDVDAAWGNEWLRENVLRGIYHDLKNKIPVYIKQNFFLPGFNLKDMRRLIREYGATRSEIRERLLAWIHVVDRAEFYAYYADYDWVVFCWLFGRMIDLPKDFPMYCRDLKQILDDYIAQTWKDVEMSTWGHQGRTLEEIKAMSDYPQQQNEHNALDDAKWNLELFRFIERLKAA